MNSKKHPWNKEQTSKKTIPRIWRSRPGELCWEAIAFNTAQFLLRHVLSSSEFLAEKPAIYTGWCSKYIFFLNWQLTTLMSTFEVGFKTEKLENLLKKTNALSANSKACLSHWSFVCWRTSKILNVTLTLFTDFIFCLYIPTVLYQNNTQASPKRVYGSMANWRKYRCTS